MTAANENTYALGHDDPELARLEHQARMLAPATEAILRLAGLRPGMRVLDLGTGPGDVALAAAGIVGDAGEVVGIDQEEKALALARRRAADRGLRNVAFERGDVRDWRAAGRFDAVVGRLILLYCPDVPAVIRHHLEALEPGGVYVAMEYDMTATRAEPACPAFARAVGWVVEGFRRGGMDPALGLRLGPVLRAAGLDPTVLGLQIYVSQQDGARALAGIVSTLLPLIEKTGTATAEEVDIATLPDRLMAELAAADAVPIYPTLVGAWASRP
ncbi:methyltransferase domain-containing protein [Thermoactinospora rubra]|uniref:methyltransferase domain-containing protein n=1 Tax=Thermoactinospora rubra TaxID=1088767 RepID=UPI00118056BC|nr:methyltransferase domain-containing protein [Thermoactinospora rubra]